MTRTGSLTGTRVLAAETTLTAVGNTTITGTLKLHELSTNGQHKVSISAPDSLTNDYSLTLPENHGNNNQVLTTNGSGTLTWEDQNSGLEENVSVSGTLSVSGTTTLNSDTTINADLNISNDLNVSGTSTIDGISTFNNNVTINGSLTVNGSSTYVYSENLVIKDPLIKLADNNVSNNVDIGFYGEYNSEYNSKYSGLIRNPNDEEWYLFKDSNDDPPNMSNLEPANLNSNLDGGVVIKVIAKTTLSKGHAVYIHSDTDNDNTYVDKAIANDTSKMPSFGLILKNTNANSTGYVITLGNIINVIASDIVESGITLNNRDICYISASETGKITNVAPSSESNRIQNIGIVIRINNNKVSLRVGGAGRTNACPSLNHNNIFIGDSNNNVSTTSFNNALLNSNAVLTSGNQTIDGTKTFNNTINASITGNAGTVTNGIYTTSSVTDLSDISSSGSGQIITSAERTKLTNFNASEINGSIKNNQLEHSSMTIDGASVSLGGSINTSNTTYTNGSGITLTGTTFSANVDDTSIEHDTNGKISIKNSGVTNDMLSGSISNDKLAGNIANNQLEHSSMTIDGASVSLGGSINTSNTTYTNGSGITLTGTTFSANVDDTSIEHDTNGKISIKNSGVTNDMLSGSISNDKLAGNIANDKLVNSSMTIDGASVSLGGSINTSNTTYTNGSGITLTGTTFSANVDDTSIEHDTNGKISIKNSGVTNGMLAGSIANDKLAGSIANDKLEHSSMTIDGASVSLGGSINTSNTTYTNGSGITLTGTTFSANVDDTSIEHDTNGKISIKNSGVTNDMLSGSISNDKLAGNIANNQLEHSSMTIDGASVSLGGSINTSNTTYTNGSGITLTGTTFSANVDDTSIEHDTNGKISIKNSGVTNDMLSGSISNDKLAGNIANDKLVNSSMTIDGASVSLGGSINTSNTTYTNGSGITLTGTTFSANVDDTSIEHDTNGKISIKNSGVTNDMLSGSISNDKLAGNIANDKLVNSSMTIDGASVSLGGSINTSNTTYTNGSGITLTGTTFYSKC